MLDPADWASRELLLRLLLDGAAQAKAAWAEELDALCRAGWVRRMDRSGKRFGVIEGETSSIEARLDRRAPGLFQEALAVRAAGLSPYDQSSYRIVRRLDLSPMPAEASRKVVAARLGRNSKAAVPKSIFERHRAIKTLGDGCIRIRSATPLLAQGPRGNVDLCAATVVAGEAALPERFLDEIMALEGHPRVALTVENAGAFLDVPLPEHGVVVFAPGTDTAPAARFVSMLPPTTPLVHFGDFDPRGLEAAERLNRAVAPRPFAWLVPDFLGEYAATHWMPLAGAGWPERAASVAGLADLARSTSWMEQEALLFDPRLSSVIEGAAQKAIASASLRIGASLQSCSH